MKKPKPGTKLPQKSEYSAGGIVQDGDKLLVVRVQNREGQIRWTFPKGHLEPGETEEQAALREVEEETGYKCEIIKHFERVQYFFQRPGELVDKNVSWFLMKPLAKVGTHDAEEILEVEWVSPAEAGQRVTYTSDLQLLAKLNL